MDQTSTSEARSDIQTITTGAEFKRWYWRKDELIERARQLQIKTTSGKFIILDRLAHFLDTGEKAFPGDQKPKATSRFDWHAAPLTKGTVITDNYKNSQNVRRFFKAEIGDSFKFSIAFMEWITSNTGKTLEDACAAYLELREKESAPGARTQIKSHNQFNQYTRDFLDDNDPANRTMKNLLSSLNYGIYIDSAHSQPWGSLPGATVSGVGAGLSQSYPVYGRIPAGQTAAVGVITDSVLVTVSY
ncbi:MAG: hypothetical protein ACJA06_002493 [Halocynthiibacter sp.]|jgi:hypothetical protein